VSTAYGPAWTNPDDKTVGGVPAAAKSKGSKRPRATPAPVVVGVVGSLLNDTESDPALAFDKRAVLDAFSLSQ